MELIRVGLACYRKKPCASSFLMLAQKSKRWSREVDDEKHIASILQLLASQFATTKPQ